MDPQQATSATREHPAIPSANGRQQLQPQPPSYTAKRLLLGPALPTKNLAHERLGKFLALPIFSSDALSSVAYATEEMMIVLAGAGMALSAFTMIMPITAVIVGVLVTLVFSYRQTIKAYPSAGGAYIVTKDNFGLLPAQVAGVALLTDYVLTVAVSVSAGVAAIGSVIPFIYHVRVELALFFVLVLAWGNLRGVRESGKLFAAPTYVFITSVFVLLAVGGYRIATGTLQVNPHAQQQLAAWHATGSLTSVMLVWIFLKALASGSTAMTGVEAISNGVPAFRPVEWRNARTTLLIMGSLLGTMFLGISFLAHKTQAVPDKSGYPTLLQKIAELVFGTSPTGKFLVWLLAVATMAVLVLAANTSFADFPRLANFHAGDSFMPRQLTKRGHRLVFSNGIIALAAAAAVLIAAFQANVTRLIPFYAIGVFTSFTLSQAGMAKRHLRLREPGWRHGLAINGFGAFATGVITIIVAATKFTHGAWAILIIVPAMVWLLVRMNKRYENEDEELAEGLTELDRTRLHRPIALVMVDDLDHKTLHALQYALTIRPQATQAVHFEREGGSSSALRAKWDEMGIGVPLKVVKASGEVAGCLAGYVGALPEDLEVNVIMPGPSWASYFARRRNRRQLERMTRALLPYHRARITLVRDHAHEYDEEKQLRLGTVERHRPRENHKVVVLVDRVDRASVEAVRFGLSLGGDEIWGVHAAVDHENQLEVLDRWLDLFSPVPLRIIECLDRNVARSIESYVVEIAGSGDEVTVVLPRRDYAEVRQRILHDRTSRQIEKALARYSHVDVSVVPYYFERTPGHQPDVRTDLEPEGAAPTRAGTVG
jgi:amino acid transporter